MKRRPPQSALTRSTDGGSGRLERWGNSTPPHAGQAGGSGREKGLYVHPMTEPTIFIIGIVASAIAILAGLYFLFRHTHPRRQKKPRKKLPLSSWK